MRLDNSNVEVTIVHTQIVNNEFVIDYDTNGGRMNDFHMTYV